VKSFNQPVRLGMVGSRLDVVDGEECPNVLSVQYSDVFIRYYIVTDVEAWPGVCEGIFSGD
jgi:hypothetical protein